MEAASMIPQETIKNFNAWAVDDVYMRWEKFAVEASILAYDFAIVRARKESDRRIARVREYVADLVEYNELVTGVKIGEEDLPVASPRQQKDMR